MRDYFFEKSTVGKWCSEHETVIDNKKWLNELKQKIDIFNEK